MKVRKLIFLIILVLFMTSFTGCSVNDTDEFLRFKLDIVKEGDGEVEVDPTRSSYRSGDEVTLKATANPGWEFVEWDGQVTGTENPITITLKNDQLPIIAIFSDKNATYTLDVERSGAGEVKISPEQENYLNGTEVTLEAVAAAEWQFIRWDGDLQGTDNPATITMKGNKQVTAVFWKMGESGIEFADPHLEQAVRSAIGKATGPITLEDVQLVNTIDLNSLLLTSLEGIQYLTALNWLNLSETGTTDISLMSSLTQMQSLYLADNEISDIGVLSGMLNLVELDLNQNQIEDISPLKWPLNKNLQVLRLGDNKITDIAVLSNISSLEVLELHNNRISSVEDLAQLEMLRELNLAGNRIEDISPIIGDVFSLDTLEILNLSDNQIIDIGMFWLWENGNLRELYLGGNQITEIHSIYGLENLEVLDLSNNDIIDMGVFKGITNNIRELKLNGNRITDIDNLEDMTSLEKLYLHDNQIINITILLELNNLQEVSLMNNPPLDTSPGTDTWDVIQELRSRGVIVLYSDSSEVN